MLPSVERTMKSHSHRSLAVGALLFVLLLIHVQSGYADATVQAYPQPSIYPASSVYSLKVNGTNVPIVNYTGDYDYAQLSVSSGAATFEVTALTQGSITSYGISPKKLNITGSTTGNKLTFTLAANQYLILRINSLKRLVICADAAETDVPAASGAGIFNVTNAPYNADNTGATVTTAAIQNAINDAGAYGSTNGQGTVYVPAGLYLSGNLKFKSNMALYLQGGAVIRCTGNPADYQTNQTFGPLSTGTWFLYVTNGTNMKIYGRGTVDANGDYMVYSKNFAINTLMPINCTNFTADGVTFRDSGGWAIIPCIAANVTFNNLKILNKLSVGNSDGIDVNCSQNVGVSNVVAIGLDDPFSTKTYTSIPWPGANMKNSNIVFDNCLAWTICYAFKVGQGVQQVQESITFKNGVAYDCAGAICVDHKNGANVVNNVTFDTIDVERVSYINDGHGAWAVLLVQNGLGDGGGPSSNILIKNITVRDAGKTGGFIKGLSSYASINNITFDHVYMPGSSAPASNLFQMVMTNTAFYSNVTILPAQAPEPLLIQTQPSSKSLYVQQTAQLTVSAWGNPPLNYQWLVRSNASYMNLADNIRISGAQTPTLTISNLAYTDETNYSVVVSDFTGSVTSSVAMLTVSPPLGPPQYVTLSSVQPNVTPAVDWDTGSYWSSGQPASTTAAAYPGSTFEILSGAAMRTPASSSTANFPGGLLTLSGNGVSGSASLGTIVLKGANPSTVNFPHLVMNGGSIGNGINNSGNAVLGGWIEVVTNSLISANNSGSGGSVQLAAQLTGGGAIEYRGYSGTTFQSTWVCSLNVSGPNNTYTGTWRVVRGTLVGSGANALGTNSITVDAAGALQTTYAINSPRSALTLNGRLNLTHDHRFRAVTVNGVALAVGQYSFAQLSAAYPANFSASWVAQPGATLTNASGSLLVGLPPAPVAIVPSWNGSQLTLSWAGTGQLLQATNLVGPWTTNAGATSPFIVSLVGPSTFFRILAE